MFSLLAAVAVLAPQEVPRSKIFAVCGASAGVSNYVQPKRTGWQEDAITGGTITLMLQSDGKPDILTRDAMGHTQFSSGSSVIFAPMIDEQAGSFIFIAIDREGNEVLTYNVSTGPDGKVTLLWTDVKNRKSAVKITKVGAFEATCENAKQ